MRKIIATTIVVFILFGTATATLDDDLLRAVGNAVISEATIGKQLPSTVIQFVNPYFYEVSAIKVFSDDLQPGLINDIDDMRINLLKAYAHTRCEFNLSDDYLFFAIPLETTGKHLMPLYPGNISIEGIWASEFFLYYSLLYKVSFYGSSGCTCIFDVQLLGFAKAEGLSDLLDGRSLTMKIRSIPATIVFEQTSDLEKFVDFLK